MSYQRVFWQAHACPLFFFFCVALCEKETYLIANPFHRGILLMSTNPIHKLVQWEEQDLHLYAREIRAFLFQCTVIRLSSARRWRRVVWWKCSTISDELAAVIPKIASFFEMSVDFWRTARRHNPENCILLLPPCKSGTRECRALMKEHLGRYDFLGVGYIMPDHNIMKIVICRITTFRPTTDSAYDGGPIRSGAAFEGGKWGDRPRPRSWGGPALQAYESVKLYSPVNWKCWYMLRLKILLQGQIP